MCAPNGLICSSSASIKPCAGDIRNPRNVVDRLFRIKLGALATDLVEDVDQVRLHVEQAKLEHSKEPARPCADDERVSLDWFSHASSASYVLYFGNGGSGCARDMGAV